MAGQHPSAARRLAVPAIAGLSVGIGDGLVGQIPVVDKYPSIHTVYRLLVAALGTAGLALDWDPGVTDSLLASSLALIGSRVPAVVQSGQLQQFGNVTTARPARARALNARPPHLRVVDGG